MQHSLFEPQEINLTPAQDQSWPRLWIKRVAIFSDPTTLLRDIPLRKGVNVIWSPDLSTNENGATPHGSGKSTFCRIIRYCLGEKTFASDDQRALMRHKLPNGFVGAEIIVDGECWVVTRPIGMSLPSRVAKADRIEETFDELLVATDPSTIGKVISDTFCASYRDQVPDNLSPDQVWDTILAWLARDQECRLDDVFDWRSKRSGSGSPAQELSNETKLAVVRLALGALSANEVSNAAEIRSLVRNRDDLKQHLQYLDWLRKEQFVELTTELAMPADRDPADETVRKEMIDKANEMLAKTSGAPHAKGQSDSIDLQAKRGQLQVQRNEIFEKQVRLKARVDTLPREISAARGELGTELVRLESGTVVRCSICLVPIDTVKAEGCNISLERCDLEVVKKRMQAAEQEVERLETMRISIPDNVGKLASEIDQLDGEIAVVDGEIQKRANELSKASAEGDDARELVRKAISFDRRMLDRDVGLAKLRDVEAKIEGLREKITLERERARAAISDLETVFQQLVVSLMPKGYTGKIRLDGNGLDPQIVPEHGVSLSTAAVESFKIVMFDLSALILAVNGKAKLPPLLIHDSPREADLDARIYSNLFDFMLGMESQSNPVPFQYIITTTTAPSQAAIEHNANCLKLSSTPASDRLFAMDF